jgi:hypothetical protein
MTDEKTSIAGGIGDMLMTRLLFDTHGLNDYVYYNTQISTAYRNASKAHVDFVTALGNKLFPNRFCVFNDPSVSTRNYIDEYEFQPGKLNLKQCFPVSEKALRGDYIVIHAKCRLDRGMDEMYRDHIPYLREFLSQKKFTLPVFIVGDRTVSDNHEARTHRQVSIWDSLMLLKPNNDLFDATTPDLYNSPSFHGFMRDMYLLAGAKHVFGLGWGGNFAMSWACTSDYSFFVHDLDHKYLSAVEKTQGDSSRICRTFQGWVDKMNTL